MIVNVRLFCVLPFLVSAVVMTVEQRVVIMLMGMPEAAVLEIPDCRADTATMVMRHMVMVVSMDDGIMDVLRLPACAVCALIRSLGGHSLPPLSRLVVATGDCGNRLLLLVFSGWK